MNKKSLEECRACLRKTDKRHRKELFKSWLTSWAKPRAILADNLAKLADIEISEDDQHSKFMCLDCYGRLADACSFILTVKNSDRILKNRIESTASTVTEPDSSWPKPILLNKSLNRDVENRVEVEIKQEVLSEDENGSNDMDLDWEPTMDIKIEPEEIVAPVQSDAQLNGCYSKNENEETIHRKNSNISFDDEYLDNSIKQEPLSGDEQDAVPDLPLDCMLCLKGFNSVTGLKAHVIAHHSYGAVKRKSEDCPSPVKETLNDFVCATCKKCCATRTDLMVHEASHGKHACYVCDAKFNSFRQLSRHGARCRPRNTLAPNTRPPSRPQVVSHTNNSTKEENGEPVRKQPRNDTLSKEIKDKTTENQSKAEPLTEIKLEPVERQSNGLSQKGTQAESDQKQSLNDPSSEETKVELVIKQSIDKPVNVEAKDEAVEKQSIEKPLNEEAKDEAVEKQPIDKHINDEVNIEIREKVITEFTNDKTKGNSPEEQLSTEHLNDNTSTPIIKRSHSEPVNKETGDENVESIEKQSHIESSDEDTNVPNEKQSRIEPVNKETKLKNVKAVAKQSNNELLNDETKSEVVLKRSINEPSSEVSKGKPVEEKPNIESSDDDTKVKQILKQSENVYSTKDITEAALETHISSQNSTDTFKISVENLDIDQDESSESESETTMAESIEEIVARLHSQDETEQTTINIPNTNEQTPTKLDTNAIQDTESESSLEQKSELENSLSNEFNEKKSNSTQDTVLNTDAVNEMQIHLAINPLSERDSVIDSKMDIEDSESVRSEGCDQKLVNLLSELSDDNVTQ